MWLFISIFIFIFIFYLVWDCYWCWVVTQWKKISGPHFKFSIHLLSYFWQLWTHLFVCDTKRSSRRRLTVGQAPLMKVLLEMLNIHSSKDFKDRKEIIDHVDMNFFKATKFCLSWKSKLAENLQLTCPLIYSLLLQSQVQNMLSIIVINALILNLTRLVFSFCDTSGNSIIPTKSLTTNH